MMPRQNTVGWIPGDLPKLLFNRSRLRLRILCTSIFLIVVLSLTSISFILIQPPIDYVAVQQTIIDIPTPPPFISPPILARPGPEIATPATELVGAFLYHPFVPPLPAGYLVNQIVRPIKAHRSISDECLDRWVSTGQWDDPCGEGMVQDAIVDLVYVWVNGSDPLHVKARAELLAAMNYTTTEARFREHDELRYSLRAARLATESWPHTRWHVVTADVPHPNPNNTDHGGRLGLVPQWLDIQCAFRSSDHHPSIHLHHDTEIFRLTGRPGTRLTFADAIDWLDKVIPSFNSHAVESQLPHLNPEIVADSIVALNDDQFLMMPIPPSAFHSTLYGPVFRMQPHLLVGGDASGDADGNGEWRSLGWSSHLMSQRFGLRKRPYTQHNARALSVPLMHEMSLTFGSYFAATPLSQFRGSHNAPGELEVNTIFMATHFVIERHREALLWSWIVGKWGGHRGVLGRDQKKRMWRELGGREGDMLKLRKATRSTMEDLEFNMWMAGVEPPALAQTQSGWGHEIHLGFDGRIQRVVRTIGFVNLKENIACGDAIIAALMHASTSGLSIFLPRAMSAEAPPFPQNPRAFAVRLIMRYTYAIGESPMNFIGPTTAAETVTLLEGADHRSDVLFGINDDWRDGEVAAADKVLRDWFQRRWPNKLECEV
ncbi:hypothetical protein MVEN_00613900 [Mycena venus]|uniref:Stealth protein CR3 conserved region 3 domain-containing protein n=1 Tax=Mycena venus TaxID=2733690 RepID=A0A8H6YMF9_9AGAR|nr:hypothetical protein MVEN_00613900 [Mycena venus]